MTSAGRPPPTFARSGSSSLTTTSFYAQPAVGSFTAVDSIASTPQGTPPPPHLAKMNSEPPAIYTAVYSGVPVFEMTVNNVAVMRRRDDDWLNATQILKVAGVEKGKRTKVLEKEILAGKHEKVQGGYGKYQGTWIDFQRGREFCRAYGVEDLLSPLLNLDVKNNGGSDSTPTKEQAMAAKRKRMYNSTLGHSNGNAAPLSISSTVTNAFTALGKASANQRVDSPVPRGSIHMAPLPPATFRHEMSNQSQDAWHASLTSESSYLSQMADSAYASQVLPLVDSQQDTQEPPRKRPRASTPINVNDPGIDLQYSNGQGEARILPPINPEEISDAMRAKEIMMNLFINPEMDATTALEGLTPEQIDVPLDNVGSAALHWAASLARIPLIRNLISRGASIYRVNASGETALVRGCFCTNNYDTSSFPHLLSMLHPTISIADNNGRTILHHIAVKSGMKNRSSDGRYYLQCLLEFVAKHGAASSSRSVGSKVMNLGKFIAEIVNAQDKSGDTALAIAARIGNKSIVNQLLEVGADPTIQNRAGLRPLDFGIGGEPGRTPKAQDQTWSVPPAVVRKREDILKAMKETIADVEKDFQSEIERKQAQVESTLIQLREVTHTLAKERERRDKLRQKSRQQADLRQHIQNLSLAIKEEDASFREKFGRVNGEAEAAGALAIDAKLLPPLLPPPATATADAAVAAFSEAQKEYLRSLPPVKVLRARLKAQKTHDELLRDKAVKLHDRSADLEETFRRVIALSIGVPEGRVDALLEGLVQAVESDPGEMDTARVTSFLRKVDESIGAD